MIAVSQIPWSVLANKVLLESTHAGLLTYCLWWLLFLLHWKKCLVVTDIYFLPLSPKKLVNACCRASKPKNPCTNNCMYELRLLRQRK